MSAPARPCTKCGSNAVAVAADATGLEWFECANHGPRDNRAGVERVSLTPIEKWFADRGLLRCNRCMGCGKIASGEEGAPWVVWLDLPLRSALAVIAGIVHPIDCPDCKGTGKAAQP